VSPLWRDEIGAYLAPGRMCLVRLKRGLKPAVVARHEQSFDTDDTDGWAAALGAFGVLLGSPTWQAAQVRIVLANHWARYAVVPWSVDLSSPTERLAHAKHVLASTYGEIVNDWETSLSEAPPLKSRVACTMPAALLSELRGACAQHRIPIASLQPQLIAAYGSWRHLLPRAGAWFVTVEQGSLAAARIGEHGWDRVHSVRIGHEWARELKRLQTFGRIASESPDEGRVYVDAPAPWRQVAGEAGKDLQWLEEEGSPSGTLQHLGRLRRFAA